MAGGGISRCCPACLLSCDVGVGNSRSFLCWEKQDWAREAAEK